MLKYHCHFFCISLQVPINYLLSFLRCSNLLPILKMNLFVSLLRSSFVRSMYSQYCLQIYSLAFHISVFDKPECSDFDKIKLIMYSFMVHIFYDMFKKSLPSIKRQSHVSSRIPYLGVVQFWVNLYVYVRKDFEIFFKFGI